MGIPAAFWRRIRFSLTEPKAKIMLIKCLWNVADNRKDMIMANTVTPNLVPAAITLPTLSSGTIKPSGNPYIDGIMSLNIWTDGRADVPA